jgi:hypothetical protein
MALGAALGSVDLATVAAGAAAAGVDAFWSAA